MDQNNLEALNKITNEEIRDKYFPVLSTEYQQKIDEMHKDLVNLSKFNEHNAPLWVVQAINAYIKEFVNFFNDSRSVTRGKFDDLWKSMYIHINNGPGSNYHPRIPTLVSWALSKEGGRLTTAEVQKMVEEGIEKGLLDSQTDVKAISSDMKKIEQDAKSTLDLLKKASGKIAVEQYAEIFEEQSNKHSKSINISKPSIWKFKIEMGKSQWWILVGLSFCLSLVLILLNNDNFIIFENSEWSPKNIAHLVSRSIIISLNIFLISFSFKQYRINKHLHTLNKHRANTLKSFEYLTKAPDKLDSGSYNAILMKVAESIYEAGHTGYINGNDTNNDMPSIIDMTKIITPGKDN